MKHHAVLTGALLALVLAGCGQESEPGQPGQPEAAGEQTQGATTGQQALTSGKAVAIVEGEPISTELFQLFADSGMLRGPGNAAGPRAILDDLIDMELLVQQAEDWELPAEPEIAAQLKAQYYTLMAGYVAERYLEQHPIDDEAVAEAYAQWQQELPDTEYHARHILVDDQAQAEALIAELDEGAEFAELAEANSKDSTASRGGDLGWFGPQQMVAPFIDAVQSLEPGSYTETPVQSQFGWHVVRLEQTRDLEAPPLDEVRPMLLNQLRAETLRTFLETQREQAAIEINEAVLQEVSASAGDQAEAVAAPQGEAPDAAAP